MVWVCDPVGRTVLTDIVVLFSDRQEAKHVGVMCKDMEQDDFYSVEKCENNRSQKILTVTLVYHFYDSFASEWYFLDGNT